MTEKSTGTAERSASNEPPTGHTLDLRGRTWSNPPMRIERIDPILTVGDIATAIAEHTAVLGMHMVMDMGWVAFLADNAGHQIGLMTTDATAPVNPNVSVFVDDVDAAYDVAIETGVEIVHPISSEQWGVRRFFYRDSSGRVINVGTHIR